MQGGETGARTQKGGLNTVMLGPADIRKRFPALRRHAYLLSGSRIAADAILAIAVARLPRGECGRPGARSMTDIYKTILDAAARVHCPTDSGISPMLSRVVTMDLTTRAVLVLITVERLPAVEVAVICNLPPADVAAVLSHGRALLKASPTPRTMVF
jgi:hypothetical protein